MKTFLSRSQESIELLLRLFNHVSSAGFFVHWLLVLLATTKIAECPPEVITIDCRMIGTWMPWAFLLQELLELLLRR
jgi:hypothetical protein